MKQISRLIVIISISTLLTAWNGLGASFTNGGFESGTIPWVVSGSNINVGTSSLAYEGTDCVSANTGNGVPAGIIEQTFDTETGRYYKVVCQIGIRGIAGVAKFLTELLDADHGNAVLYSGFVNAPSSSPWPDVTYRQNVISFTASSAHTTLKFTDQTENGGASFDTYLDAVSVTVQDRPFTNGGFESDLAWVLSGSNILWGLSTSSYEGTNCIAANTGGKIPAGIIEQTFDTEPSGFYKMECQVGKRGGNLNAFAAKFQVDVLDPGNSNTVITSTYVAQPTGSEWPADAIYALQSVFFTAGSAGTTLRFTDQSENSGGGFDTYLDAITVTRIIQGTVVTIK